jgi:hypothetical protein
VVYERTPGAAGAPLPPTYRPRRPQDQPLYRIVAEHLETFLAEPLAQGAPPYPRYVERELRRFLTCSIPAHGFYRVRCAACGHERLLGLSCGGRLCPSCWARRTADVAAHLVDRVFPQAPYRQLVLSLPYKLRLYLARDPPFLSAMLGGYLNSVFAWQRHRGRVAGIQDGQTGAVTFVQRFGGALNANVHFHSITPDGLFVPIAAGDLCFVPLEPPSGEDVARLGRRVFRRLTKIATQYLAKRQHEYLDPDDELATLQHALSVALRPPVRPQRALPLGGAEQPEHQPLQQDLCTAAGGFSLHLARTVEPHDREGLEGLCRYGLRAPFSQRRLSVLPNGKVRYELARPWPTPAGVTALIMEPLELLKRLAVLLPAPYQNLTRYHGVFANRSRFRPRLPLPPEATGSRDEDADASAHRFCAHPKLEQTQPGQQLDIPLAEPGAGLDSGDVAAASALGDDDEPGATSVAPADPPAVRPRRLSWASLLLRSLGVDGLCCPHCQSQMVLLALITAPRVVAKILDHLRIPSTPPPLAPARPPPERTMFADELDQTDPFDAPDSAASGLTGGALAPRAPP